MIFLQYVRAHVGDIFSFPFNCEKRMQMMLLGISVVIISLSTCSSVCETKEPMVDIIALFYLFIYSTDLLGSVSSLRARQLQRFFILELPLAVLEM